MDHGDAAQIFVLALGAGVLAQLAARHLRMPSIVLLLAIGVGLGPDGWGLIRPDDLGEGLFQIVRLAVAIILFEGGMNLDLARLRRSAPAIRKLITVGALITGVGGALAARHFMGWDWTLAALFGALVTVTGPTVIKPLLRLVPLRPRLATVLEAEGVLIDPVGAILAAVTLEIVVGALGVESVATGVFGFFARLAVGAGLGAAAGWLVALLLRSPRIVPEGLENLVTLGSALLIFEAAEAIVPESGILAVTLAGAVLGNMETRLGSELGEFEEQLTIGLIGVLFILLAADVRLEDVMALGRGGLLTVAVLVLIVRPLNVMVSTAGSDLDWRDRAFLSWVAPRGVVAAAVASLFVVTLDTHGFEGGSEFRALVFLTIAITVVIQGGSAPLLARILGVRAPGRDRFVLLGAEELAFAVGEELRTGGRDVMFVDSNPGHCREAEERGFAIVYGNALESRTLARVRLERARAVLGVTANSEVNALFAREAFDDFGVRETYVALGKFTSGVTDRILGKQETRVLFDGPKDVERWNVRLRHDQAVLRTFEYDPEIANGEDGEGDERPNLAADPHILLVVLRGQEASPVHAKLSLQAGDRVVCGVHLAAEGEALARLRSRGLTPAAERSEGSPAE